LKLLHATSFSKKKPIISATTATIIDLVAKELTMLKQKEAEAGF